MAREMGDASKVAVAGGDGSNLFYFYTGSSSYKDNSVENIAAFAQERFESCKDKSVEEIASKHIFWGTEGPSFNGFYNGDTYVLFDDIQKLPEDVKKDAYTNCKGYRDDKGKTSEVQDDFPKESSHVTISPISPKCVKEMPGKDGNDSYYRVGVTVDKDVSENGFANISVAPPHLKQSKGTYMVDFPGDKEINVDIVQNGNRVREPMAVSDLSEAHTAHIEANKGKRRLPTLPEGTEMSNDKEYE